MENNKSYRIKTQVGVDQYLTVNLEQEYDVLEILSMKISQKGDYRYSVGDYGVVVGRVLANNGFGVPNAKLSLFIAKNDTDDVVKSLLYPYETTSDKDSDGVRYNLLPDKQKDDCHQVVGTFPNKRLMLDDASMLEIFDEYYKYTTRTNEAGDYMFFGVPTGSYTLHMDLDISDCGKLSQRPRDFIYKGYTIEQFENPNQFKTDTELSTLSQLFTQDTTIDVKPFWGDEKEGTIIGITRKDIDIAFKFEPTCVFMGSVVTDTANEGVSVKCVPSNRMGEMSELVTGAGRIEIIRKNIDNTVSELQIKGTQLVNGNGVWCFQIPMNLDYMMTDEYGNIVPTDNPEKGIPTRCEVRFRLSLDEPNPDSVSYYRSKVLIPHNPETENDVDYNFGSKTKDESFRSLMWNNVYTIKSFIPRIQQSRNIKSDKFTGIKKVNFHGHNNPMPYNNIRIRIPFMFWFMCNVVKVIISIVKMINVLKKSLMSVIGNLGFVRPFSYISNELCPDLEYWYFAPGMPTTPTLAAKIKNGKVKTKPKVCKQWENESVCQTYKDIATQLGTESSSDETIFYRWSPDEFDENGEPIDPVPEPPVGYAEIITKAEYEELAAGGVADGYDVSSSDLAEYYEVYEGKDLNDNRDSMSIEAQNALDVSGANIGVNLTTDTDYLMQCIEINLAQQYEVIKFDFYNDWINGCVYLPRWARNVKYKKRRKKGNTVITEKVKGCMNDTRISKVSRRYVEQCSLTYDDNHQVTTPVGCHSDNKLRCHKVNGRSFIEVLGSEGGFIDERYTSLGDKVYYLKPYEFRGKKRIPFFATDIVMLGNLNDCNEYGLPSTVESLLDTTYQLPPNLAATNVDNESESYMNLQVSTTQHDAYGASSHVWNSPTPAVINAWQCNEKCGKGGYMTTPYLQMDGVQTSTPTYEELDTYLRDYEQLDLGDDKGLYVDITKKEIFTGVTFSDNNDLYKKIDDAYVGFLNEICDSGNTANTVTVLVTGSVPTTRQYPNGSTKPYDYIKIGSANTSTTRLLVWKTQTEPLTMSYEDIFPITEISGIDWGYMGAGYGKDADGKDLTSSDSKMFAPGGHFLGLSCGNAETNIKSCVNLKRACEIGTTLSERLEIPVGYNDGKETANGLEYDVVNYLYVAPNGLIGKDQIIDAGFRSAFASMNHNGLKTKTNALGYKEYDFGYLYPDSFDGSLSGRLGEVSARQLIVDKEGLWDTETLDELLTSNPGLDGDVTFEMGNTIIRKTEEKSDDYLNFRMGDDPQYLMTGKMPVYRNSFYFYFGLVKGSTALDEFKSQYYAPCAPQALVKTKGSISVDEGDIKPYYDLTKKEESFTNNFYFRYQVPVTIQGVEDGALKTYTLTRLATDDYHIFEKASMGGKLKVQIPTGDIGETAENFEVITGYLAPKTTITGQVYKNSFTIDYVEVGSWELYVQDENGNEFSTTFEVKPPANLLPKYNKKKIVDYLSDVTVEKVQEAGVYVNTTSGTTTEIPDASKGGRWDSTFSVRSPQIGDDDDAYEVQYRIVIKRVSNLPTEYNINQFELVRNGYGLSGTTGTIYGFWGDWYSNSSLTFWGSGDYEVWVRSMRASSSEYIAEYRYDTFTINNGNSIPLTIGNKTLGLEEVPYEYFFNLETSKNQWWNTLGKTESPTNYSIYRSFTDYLPFTLSNEGGYTIPVNTEADVDELIYGEEEENGIKRDVIELLTKTDLEHINHTSNDTQDKLVYYRKYPFLYTSREKVKDGVYVWSTKYCEGTLSDDGSFNPTKDYTTIGNEFVSHIKGTTGYMRYYLLSSGGKNCVVSTSISSNTIKITPLNNNVCPSNSSFSIDNKAPLYLVHLLKLPTMRSVYKATVIGKKDLTKSTTSTFVLVNNPNGYNIGVNRVSGSDGVLIGDYYGKTGVETYPNDPYNNMLHEFTVVTGPQSAATKVNYSISVSVTSDGKYYKLNGVPNQKYKDGEPYFFSGSSIERYGPYIFNASDYNNNNNNNNLANILKGLPWSGDWSGNMQVPVSEYDSTKVICDVYRWVDKNTNTTTYFLLKVK